MTLPRKRVLVKPAGDRDRTKARIDLNSRFPVAPIRGVLPADSRRSLVGSPGFQVGQGKLQNLAPNLAKDFLHPMLYLQVVAGVISLAEKRSYRHNQPPEQRDQDDQ